MGNFPPHKPAINRLYFFSRRKKMDGLSAEVSEKIRAAIRAKLKELGAYVDDELPDYIMVLVANKKTQEQMKDDLSLFLHNHADVFTDWLQDILNKLKQVATTGGKKKAEKSTKEKKKKGDKDKKKKKKSGESSGTKKSSSQKVKTEKQQQQPKDRDRSRSPLLDNDRNTNNRRESHDRSRDSYGSRDRSRDSYRSRDRSRDSYSSRDRSRDSYRSTSHDRGDRDYHDRGRDYRNYNNPNDRDRNDRGMYSSGEENRRSRPVPHQQQQRLNVLDRRGGRSSRNITDHRSSRGDDRNRISSSASRSPNKNKDRIVSRSSPTSPKPSRSMKSSVSVVSRNHENVQGYDPEKILKKALSSKGADQRSEEYNPENILKKSLVASKVQVARKPPSKEKAPRNSKLLLKAVEDADKSIYKKRSEIRSKAADLDEIHRNRMKATLAAKKFQRTGGDEEILPSTSSS